MGKVIKMSSYRAGQALDVARVVAQRVQLRVVDGRETGEVWGHPDVLRALCGFIGAGKRDTSRWSVYLEAKYLLRLKFVRGLQPIEGEPEQVAHPDDDDTVDARQAVRR